MLTSVPIPDTSINGQLPRGKDDYLKGWYQYFSVKGERRKGKGLISAFPFTQTKREIIGFIRKVLGVVLVNTLPKAIASSSAEALGHKYL
ncbi:hypothetical protein [Nostoc sp.]|uniref:hypothetical protein n=1 Tax=Nostoc sp. TaxID=1180 RepID=UPI002FFBAC49